MQFIIGLQFRKMDQISEFISVVENTYDKSDYLSEVLRTPIDELNNKIIRDSMHAKVQKMINRKSMTILHPGEWLNDEVINFHM